MENTKFDQRYFNIDIKDVLDWSEVEVTEIFFKTSSRRLLGDVLKMYSGRRPEDVFQEITSRPFPGDILKTSSRRRP